MSCITRLWMGMVPVRGQHIIELYQDIETVL